MLTIQSIDRENRVLFTSAEGIVSRADILEHIARKSHDSLLEFDELFDTREASFDLAVADLPLISDTVKHAVSGKTHGRVAIVTTNSFVVCLSTAYNAIIGTSQPQLRVFRQADEAREWLLGESDDEDSPVQPA